MGEIKDINRRFIRYFIKESFSKYAKGGSLLDLGCGKLPYADIYEKYVDTVTRVDVEDRCGRVDCVADAQALPFSAGSFDMVLFSEVIEHVSNPQKALSEISRVLRADGYLFITWPIIHPMHETPHDYTRLTEFFMEKELNKNGLEILRIVRRGDIFALLHTLLGHLVLYFSAFLKMIPILRFPLLPISYILGKVVEISYAVHYGIVRKTKRLNPNKVGEYLRGAAGMLAIWTPGYCVVARKIVKT